MSLYPRKEKKEIKREYRVHRERKRVKRRKIE